jgi:glutamate/tyrosine decarboxylase-like PLP-dependent enzyme
MHHTPQSSQRARQFEVWAVLRTLGRAGVAELVQRASEVAAAIAGRLAANGFEILNEIVLNQVLVRPPAPVATAALIDEIQADGRAWCGPTMWRGQPAMRLSVSSWKTTVDDGLAAADAIIECATRVRG